MAFDHFHDMVTGKGAFRYIFEDNILAEMAYSMPNASLLIIDHTEVDESLKGQGLGKKLQQDLVDYVRANGIKVIPICPFARTQFERMKEWQDVLKIPLS